ncbi:MAG: class III signal peptide-containing protein [Bdellovibrio sp.]|nr:class III signal peptide-containing protein [Bdellovibrio sp.]
MKYLGINRFGQTTLEYILILFIVVSTAYIVGTKFIKPTYKKLSQRIEAKIQDTFKNSLYYFPVKKVR